MTTLQQPTFALPIRGNHRRPPVCRCMMEARPNKGYPTTMAEPPKSLWGIVDGLAKTAGRQA